MGIIDNGTQSIYLTPGQDLLTSDFNKWWNKVISPGVYDGGTLSIVSGNNITIAPFSAVIETSTGQTIKVKTTTNATLTIAEATPYITCQYSWTGVEGEFADFTAKALGSITTNDVILGRGVYSGGVLTSFSYIEKTVPKKEKLTTNLTVTVGTGGDYSTINEALSDVYEKYYPAYVKDGITVTINLLTGFVMTEQVLIRNLNMSWITITGDDAETTINRASLTTAFTDGTHYNAFGFDQCQAPYIDQLFTMDSTGTSTNRHGIMYLTSSGKILTGAGVKNAGGMGLYIARASTVYARSTIFSGAGAAGIQISGRSIADCSDINTSNSLGRGIYCVGSSLNCQNAVATGCVDNALHIEKGSQVYGDGGNYTSTGTAVAIQILYGSIASLNNSTITAAANYGLYIVSSQAAAGSSIISATGVNKYGVAAFNGALVEVGGANITSTNSHAVYCVSGSNVACINTIAAAPPGLGFGVLNGGIISAAGSTGTLSQTANTIAAAGIIFK